VTAVVISPHLDDAVLSCFTRLSTEPTVVVTVLGGAPADTDLLAEYDRITGASSSRSRVFERVAEDQEALTGLATAVTRLPFLDAQYGDRPSVREVADAVVINCQGADEVLFPAGLGGHVDHVLTRDACLLAASNGLFGSSRLIVYADYPYASENAGWPRWVASGLAEQFDPSDDWAGVMSVFTECGLSLTPKIMRLSDDQVANKLDRAQTYRSQFAPLDGENGRVSGPANIRFELEFMVGGKVATVDHLPSIGSEPPARFSLRLPRLLGTVVSGLRRAVIGLGGR